jgi:uncharacterized membrane protein HdeD (DUF308 family)
MFDVLTSRWWMLMLYGGLMAILGLISIFTPAETIMTLFMYLGIVLILSGALFLYRGYLSYKNGYQGNILYYEGGLNLLFGLFILLFPESTAAFIFFWLGVWIFVFGVIQISKAVQIKELYGSWGGLMWSGIVAAVVGLMIIIKPFNVAMAFTVLFGFGLLFIGLFLLNTAWQYKKIYDKVK